MLFRKITSSLPVLAAVLVSFSIGPLLRSAPRESQPRNFLSPVFQDGFVSIRVSSDFLCWMLWAWVNRKSVLCCDMKAQEPLLHSSQHFILAGILNHTEASGSHQPGGMRGDLDMIRGNACMSEGDPSSPALVNTLLCTLDGKTVCCSR